MDIGLMVEGQNGLTWERWRRILARVERFGFPSLFRSDHYFIGRQRDSLEPYLSFVLAALETRRARFGPLVTPVTFRSPVDVGRMAAQIAVLSGGRFVMGLGAGWNEPEHRAYGKPFPPVGERFGRLEEAILLIRAMWSSASATFQGQYYHIENVDARPRPDTAPPLLIGGGGERRTLRLVAQYADEWNCINLPPADYARKVAVLEEHCAAVGRDPRTIRRSMMAFGITGATQDLVDRSSERMMAFFGTPSGTSSRDFQEDSRARGMPVGRKQEVLDWLAQYAAFGVQEVQFQHVDFDSDAVPEFLATEIMPKAAAL